MRVNLSPTSRMLLFEALRVSGQSTQELAALCGVSTRTLRDWSMGRFTIRHESFQSLVTAAKININSLDFVILDDWWNVSTAGRLGADRTMKLYGQPGTKSDRSKGGNASYLVRRTNPEDIFARKEIITPAMSNELAEFIGILAGDGCLTQYQVSVALDSQTDANFVNYVVEQFNSLFGIKTLVSNKKNARCTTITASSIELVEYLQDMGVLIGHKIRQELSMPKWIQVNLSYSVAYLRGLFDTDGCIYLERHNRNSGVYAYPRMSIVSASPSLRQNVFGTLTQLNLDPRLRNNRSVNLERFTDIVKYFMIVGSSNPKHLARFRKFGEVA